MTIVVMNHIRQDHNLNIKDLFNPIFFSPDVNHGDSSRSEQARQRTIHKRTNRAFKEEMRSSCL